MYKLHNSMLPEIFKEMFVLNYNVHSYDTRQCNHYKLPLCHSNVSKKSIRYAGPTIWNKISETIRLVPTLNSFKTSIKYILLGK